jgi:DNA adenine methylase
MTTVNNTSPLRYPGGKTRARALLWDIVKSHFDTSKINTVVSPFFGGGSFEFHLQSQLQCHIHANDKFAPLYTFWETAKTDNANLVAQLRVHQRDGVTKADFGRMRQTIVDSLKMHHLSSSHAVMYFAINRCSFSGATLSGGFSAQSSAGRFTTSSIDRVERLDLSNVSFTPFDFEPFIASAPTERCLMFVDPPYLLDHGSKLYGTNGDLHETFDHERLAKCMKKRRGWIMTYNNCIRVRDLYKEYTIIELDWKYGMNASKSSSEIAIIAP